MKALSPAVLLTNTRDIGTYFLRGSRKNTGHQSNIFWGPPPFAYHLDHSGLGGEPSPLA